MSKSIVLYLHVHQPYRIRSYSMFDIKNKSDYFESKYTERTSNERILQKVAEKSYIPTNKLLIELLNKHPEFTISISITGTVIEQFAQYAPEVLASFQELVATGKVEIVGETYHHSLAFFYNIDEFATQVAMHRQTVERYFGVTPQSFRNTELAYNDSLAEWANLQGYKAIIAEGWDPILGWRSPNFVYKASNKHQTKLLLKNYRLSDDIAFRFSETARSSQPLTAATFAHWLHETNDAEVINLFMDYETFGEHQWEDTGIFDFLRHLPSEWLKLPGHDFKTISEAADAHDAKDIISMPETVTWADTERDLTAWIGNPMQRLALEKLYALAEPIIAVNDWSLIEDWRKLQTSDHFYYMCTKWFSDGDVHAYFSPYESPYDAFVYFMNCYHDLKARLLAKGIEV